MTLVTADKVDRKYLLMPSQRAPCACDSDCGRTVNLEVPANYEIAGKPVTMDCYFRTIGEHIDSHPINTPQDME